ncbi:hypothetical protein KZ810_13225 [Sphingomonas sp. RHCKR47]|uniref:hypothetical protein n=1 Tax=Sphingomonas citricola TaxID=2862498 RepID=UPI001CA483A5|nr:hypothetical protein [Sphingomonas citricola]MBW6524464.1 hypothetical protein [Sphingomonas citricola]
MTNILPESTNSDAVTFQERVQPWLLACFGEMIAGDREERNHRFLEEALELVQSTGCTASEAHQLVDYVFARPVGEPVQEVGGVMVTLAALCLANHLDMHAAAEAELARIWTKVEAIRAKQAAKPKHSPLPSAWERRLQLVKDHCEVRDQRWLIPIDAAEEPCAVRVIHRQHGDYMDWPEALEEQGVCVAADRAYTMQEESRFYTRSAAMRAAHDFLRRFGAGEVEYLEWDIDSQSMVVVGHSHRRNMNGWHSFEADRPDPLAPFYAPTGAGQ